MIASFGPKVFKTGEKQMTFHDFSYKSSVNSESQNTDGGKPVTVAENMELDSMAFKVSLSASFGHNPRKELDEWNRIKDQMLAYPFILGNKPLGGKWKVLSVDLNESMIDHKGNMLSATIALSFQEYVKKGVKKEKKKEKKTKERKELGVVTTVNYKPARRGPE